MGSRTVTTTLIGAAAAVGMTLCAAPALAVGPHGGGGPGHHHLTLAQARKGATHELSTEIRVLRTFDSVAADDGYVGTYARNKAVDAGREQIARDRRAEAKIADASSIAQIGKALREAHPAEHGHHPDDPSLKQRKNDAQLFLDGQIAVVDVQRALAADHPHKSHPDFAKALRQIEKAKQRVDAATDQQQIDAALGHGRQGWGPGGGHHHR